MNVITVGKRPYSFPELLKLLQSERRAPELLQTSLETGFLTPNGFFATSMDKDEAKALKRLRKTLARKDARWCAGKSLAFTSVMNCALGPPAERVEAYTPPNEHRYRFGQETAMVRLWAGNYPVMTNARFYRTIAKRHPKAVPHIQGNTNYKNQAILFLEDKMAVAMLMPVEIEGYFYPPWHGMDRHGYYDHALAL